MTKAPRSHERTVRRPETAPTGSAAEQAPPPRNGGETAPDPRLLKPKRKAYESSPAVLPNRNTRDTHSKAAFSGAPTSRRSLPRRHRRCCWFQAWHTARPPHVTLQNASDFARGDSWACPPERVLTASGEASLRTPEACRPSRSKPAPQTQSGNRGESRWTEDLSLQHRP
jgi:hypothetical protein